MASEWDKDHTEKYVFILVSRNEILVVQMIVADYIRLVKRPVFAIVKLTTHVYVG